jgi:hypothetical protein
MSKASKALKFTARPERAGPGGAWTYLRIPIDVQKEFGTKARVSVRVTLNGAPFRTSLFPDGAGGHTMMYNKEMQKASGAGPGDAVRVTLERDAVPRTVPMPPDLKQALSRNRRAQENYEKFPPGAKKMYVGWITGAKLAETRARRIEKAVGLLAAGKKLD